jgi:GH24 family phage-related lysozyme (muramidase)
MNYAEGRAARNKGLSGLIVENLLDPEMGIGQSFSKALSDRTKATFTGIKEAFDPLNIAKKLTGGSRLAPALLGRLTGRNSSSIQYFSGRKKTTSTGVNFETGESIGETPVVQTLGFIFEELIRADKIKKEEQEDFYTKENQREKDELDRTEALIQALTGRQVKKEKKEYIRDEKGRFAKKPSQEKVETPKTTPKAETPKAETPKPSATKEPKVTPKTPTAPSIKKPSIIPGAAKGAAAIGFGAMAAKTLAAEEGFSAKAYWDPQGQNKLVSIGYGHQIKQNEYAQGYIQAGDERIPIVGDKGIDTKITKEQALKLKEKDLEIYTNDTVKSIGQDAWDKLSDQQKVALVSSTYNTGKGGMDYLVKNGLRDAIIREDYKGAADIIRKYGFKTEKGQKSPALEKRRYREAAMFEEGTASKLQPQLQNNLGNQIDASSVENKNLKKDVNDLPAPINVNNTSINKTTNTSPKTEDLKEDDRPAYFKKRRG